MKAFAAKGKVQIQAQSDDLELFADQVAKFISAKKSIQIAAKDEVLLTAKGSYIKINGSGIEQGTPATHIVYAATKAMLGPKSLDTNLPEFKKYGNFDIQFYMADKNNNPYKHQNYVAIMPDGSLKKGKTDGKGYTEFFKSAAIEEIVVHLIFDEEWQNA